MGARPTDRPRVRETTLWCALSEVKRVFVVAVLATVSYSWPNPKRSLTYSSSSSGTFRIALEVLLFIVGAFVSSSRIAPPLPAFVNTVSLGH
jgi:hypothetical protein